MISLERREIQESLVGQGVHGFDQLKSNCSQFECYWKACCIGHLPEPHRRAHDGENVTM